MKSDYPSTTPLQSIVGGFCGSCSNLNMVEADLDEKLDGLPPLVLGVIVVPFTLEVVHGGRRRWLGDLYSGSPCSLILVSILRNF